MPQHKEEVALKVYDQLTSADFLPPSKLYRFAVDALLAYAGTHYFGDLLEKDKEQRMYGWRIILDALEIMMDEE